MKKFIATTLTLASLSTFAGTTAGLNLKGTVAPFVDISIEAETLATNLPLNQAVTNQKIGKVIEKSNAGGGYKVSVSSQNGGKLVRAGDSSNFVNYQLSYNNSNAPLNQNPSQVGSHSGRGEAERELRITYSKPSDYLASGEYTDVVTFTISAN